MKNKKPTITAHVLVKNEENYIWYAINSVLPYVDKMIIFDTGSTDKTIEFINDIVKKDKIKKIIFEEKGEVDKQKHTDLRNEMIFRTKTDWILLVDGDEVWDSSQILESITELEYQPLNRYLGLVSFHLSVLNLKYYTERGQYNFPWGLHNQLNMRFIRMVDGIQFKGPYGSERLYIKNVNINEEQKYFFVLTTYYYHFSKLVRSSCDKYVFERKKSSKGKILGPLRRIILKNTYKFPDILNERH